MPVKNGRILKGTEGSRKFWFCIHSMFSHFLKQGRYIIFWTFQEIKTDFWKRIELISDFFFAIPLKETITISDSFGVIKGNRRELRKWIENRKFSIPLYSFSFFHFLQEYYSWAKKSSWKYPYLQITTKSYKSCVNSTFLLFLLFCRFAPQKTLAIVMTNINIITEKRSVLAFVYKNKTETFHKNNRNGW